MKKTISRPRTPNGLKSNVRKTYPSIRAFYEHIQEYPEMLTMKEGSAVHSISASLISSSSQGDHLMLYDKDLLAEFDNKNDTFADATFKVSPNIKGVNQLLTTIDTDTAKESDIDDIDDTDDEDSIKDLNDVNYLSESDNDELKLVESTVEPVQESIELTMKPVAKSPQEVLEPVEPSPPCEPPILHDAIVDCRIPFFQSRLLRGHTLLASPPELDIFFRTRCLVPSCKCGSRFCRRWQVPNLLCRLHLVSVVLASSATL
ncbi:unnamed protein product [Trichogramma brassicae]|uniref:Uncharacterized protein n=1 Tax=Trichogramma brassicae TaxID=86971 RepID=A0A6H5IT50_9HYME|nr:unnamed protein product [Trichogramma brassicae]